MLVGNHDIEPRVSSFTTFISPSLSICAPTLRDLSSPSRGFQPKGPCSKRKSDFRINVHYFFQSTDDLLNKNQTSASKLMGLSCYVVTDILYIVLYLILPFSCVRSISYFYYGVFLAYSWCVSAL